MLLATLIFSNELKNACDNVWIRSLSAVSTHTSPADLPYCGEESWRGGVWFNKNRIGINICHKSGCHKSCVHVNKNNLTNEIKVAKSV